MMKTALYPADLVTTHQKLPLETDPLHLFEQLYFDQPEAIYLESLLPDHNRGRYTLMGSRPLSRLLAREGRVEVTAANGRVVHTGTDLFDALRFMKEGAPRGPSVKPFSAGVLGYMGYDAIRYVERLPDDNPDPLEMPEAHFIVPSELLVVDHHKACVDVICTHPAHDDEALDSLISRIKEAAAAPLSPETEALPVTALQGPRRDAYAGMVDKCREYILAGDVFQVVPSQRLTFETASTPLSYYRALRRYNPSPYMFVLKMHDFTVLGSSPEVLVRCEGGMAETRPLAGTRPRGGSLGEDDRLAGELMNDEKERAEHVMLVDLARSDLGRVCRPGTVKTPRFMEIDRFARVMHMVSRVEGDLAADKDVWDLVAASFPAGTVSGSPKIRAMEIIEELEPVRRGIYAGAVGFADWNGDMELSIAIRTLLLKGGTGHLQVGAGIVADSDPDKEYEETLNKARALLDALGRGGVS